MPAALRRAAHDEQGQAVVELALTLPLMALLLLGLLQVGFVVNTKQQLEGVARQGARTFALTGDLGQMRDVLLTSGRQLRDFESRATVELILEEPGSGHRALQAPGRISGVTIPPGIAKKLRGGWVEVTVTYGYPNPVQATVFGQRILPATIPLTTRSVSRVEVDLQ